MAVVAYTRMAFHQSALFTLYFLLLWSKYSPVVSQIPTASPIPSVGQAPASAEIPAPAGPFQPEPQVTNMIEGLRDAGRFGAIAGLLDGLQMKSLTPMTTWFLPNDQAFSRINYPENVTTFLDYHVTREFLPFSRLLTLSIGTPIPTFLGKEVVLVTNNSQFNFSIVNAMVVVPDLYTDNTIAVHGIDAVLDNPGFTEIAPSPGSIVPPLAPPPFLFPLPVGQVPAEPVPFNATIPNLASSLSVSRGLYLKVVAASIVVTAILA